MTVNDENMISVSHWGLHQKKPIEIVRKLNPFRQGFPYPNVTNKDVFRAWFLDIKV